MNRLINRNALPLVLSLLLIGGAAADRFSLPNPGDANSYHGRVRAAAVAIPTRIGDWVGTDVAVPTEAVDQLRPNVILSKRFEHVRTGVQVSLLFVQCQDVRDLVPHYPPICYPGRGLSLTASPQKDWVVDDWVVRGTEYAFESNTFRANVPIVVANFVVLPDGRVTRDMTDVRAEASLAKRYYGAAQVQLVFNAHVAEVDRDEAIVTLLEGYRPLIDAVRSGVAGK